MMESEAKTGILSSPGACAVTGASGYVGSRVAMEIGQRVPVVALSRHPRQEGGIAWSLGSMENIAKSLQEKRVSVLLHAAWDFSAVTAAEIHRVNVEGSIRLFRMAMEAGVDRVVFISTISAFAGARSTYGKSKLEVEAAVAEIGGIILRPGLVFGPSPGGMFGSIRQQIRKGRIVPLIGDGATPQYLVPEAILARVAADAALGQFDGLAGKPITIANPRPWPFRDLVRSIAKTEGRQVTLVPLPWQLLYLGLRAGEALGKKLPFRSDSVVSFIFQNPTPDFAVLAALGISVPEFEG